MEEPSLKGVPLFFVHDVTRVRTRSWMFAPRETSVCFDPRVKGFELVAGHHYRLRVLQHSEPSSGVEQNFQVNCDFRGDSLELESAADILVGRYDAVEFTLVAKATGYTELALVANPVRDAAPAPAANQAATQAQPSLWPRIFSARIPIGVRRDRLLLGLEFAARTALAAVAVYAFVSAPTWYDGAHTNAIRTVASALALSALGKIGGLLLKSGSDSKKLIDGL